MSDHQRREVEWYQKNGKHPERIVNDSTGQPYVIGDAAWNRAGRPNEIIEQRMGVELRREP